MIEKIALKNFKGFENLQLDQLSQITLLGGDNSVGKTSILEAIFLFFDRGNPEMLLRQFTFRGINKFYLSTEQLFSPLFHDYDRKRDIAIALTIDGKEEKLRFRFSDKLPERRVVFEKWGQKGRTTGTEERPVIHGKIDIEFVKSGHSERSELIIVEKGLKLRDRDKDKVSVERRPAVYLSPRIPASPAEDAQRFGELDREGRLDAAVAYLKAFDSRIKGLSSIFYGDSAVLHADIGLSQKVPVPQLGEGLTFALSMYLAMSAAKEGTVLVDELGSGIHHSILPKFWASIAEAAEHFRCQLIATTHSYECMEAATKGLKSLSEPKFTYIRLDREKEFTTPNVYSFPILEAAISSGWEVR